MELNKQSGYLASGDNYDQASLVIYGAPMDLTTSYRPGTRFGPRRAREVSEGLEEYSHVLDKQLSEIAFYDAGDVYIPYGNVERGLQGIKAAAMQIFADNKFPLLIGGEHLVSLPAIEAAHAKYEDLVLLHFDAHTDLRDEFHGERNSHATVIGHAAKLVGGKNVYQFGIRSGVREEFAYARKHMHIYPGEVIEPLMRILPELGNRPIYCTIDIDVMDSAYVPGTGTPEAGGISSREMLQVIYALKEKNVIGMDIVELSPVLDVSDITSLLVAKMIREAVLTFGKEK